MKKLYWILPLFFLSARPQRQEADLLVYHARIYTLDGKFQIVPAMVLGGGKILATGDSAQLAARYHPQKLLDAGGKCVYPGLIDAHAHFFNYGLTLQTADLTHAASWEEILQKVKDFAGSHPGGWLIGRGWDQNRWPGKEFPDNEKLNALFPNRPVYLVRVDGHAAIANQKALELAGVQAGRELTGGQVEVKNGRLTGILLDNAKELVSSKIPAPTPGELQEALLAAQANCFAAGLTTVDDCGLDKDQVLLIDRLQQSGQLKMRIYAMLSDRAPNFAFLQQRGRIKTGRLNVRSFKVYADGALGSRGACLLEPYTDKPGWQGFLLSQPAHFDSVAAWIKNHGFQMCTHAIGDSGNRAILKVYSKYLGGKNDLRWRIEHAQVVSLDDFYRFGQYSIIPSVQPTHATSDMYWAGERLGPQRLKGAYAYRELLQENGWIPLGTDFPIEDISPIKTFYAAVFRKDASGWPAGGFQPASALDRKEALQGMTIWAAKANFEEGEKGSLEAGKWADFVILDQDLMEAPPEKILQTRVLATYVNGEKVYTPSDTKHR